MPIQTPTPSLNIEATKTRRRSITLVLPAWNEAEALPRAIHEADAALNAIADAYEILVVDDGSTDSTAAVVSEASNRFQAVRLIRHEANCGYGAALRTGFAAARCELVAFTDADNQFDLTELDRFALLAERYDIVCGYRIDRQDTALRRFYSRGYNLLVRLLLGTGVRDIDCALKMFRREVVQQLEITTDGFLVNSELLTQAKQQGRSIVEVGVSHRPRTEGTSTVSIAHIPRVLADLTRCWWNRVQFPGASDSKEKSGINLAKVNWGTVLLLLVASFLLLTSLGYPLIDRDETRYAEIPREMVATGNWVLPQLNFRPYYDKPPLMYWLCSISYTLFGVSEWAARLPHALSCMATLAVTVLFARRWFGPAVGFASGLVLLLSVGFLGSSRVLLLDGLLMLLVTLSLTCGYEAVRGVRFHRGWWFGASLACGAAFLTKGPIGFVLLAPPLIAYCFLTSDARRPRLPDWAGMLSVVAAISVPWFVAVSGQDQGFAYEFFYKHNVERFAGSFHPQPFWYFLPIVLVAGHPWSFLTISFTRFLGSHSEKERLQRPPALGYLVLWAGWCVLFFSLSRCKLPSYILPALPAFAMMFGYYAARVLFAVDRPQRWLESVAPWNAALVTGLAGIGFATFCGLTGVESAGVAIAAGLFWVFLTVATQIARRYWESPRSAWGVSLATAFLLGVFTTQREIPLYATQQTLFGPGSPHASQDAAVDSAAIVTLSHEWAEVPFYLGRDNIENLTSDYSERIASLLESEKRLLVVVRKKDNPSKLASVLPPRAEMRPLLSRGPGVLFEVTAGPDAVAKVPGQTTLSR